MGARCAGGGDGCCTFHCLSRLFMIPIFMMSCCCPLCAVIAAAFLFSSCHSGCRRCGHRRYRCSTWRRSASGVGGGGSSPRFRCSGTTGMATSVASATSSETQQKQSDSENQSKIVSANISASAAPKTEPAAALQPLLEEVVAKGEPDGEDVALQRALAESFLECNADSSEQEPQPEHDLQPRPEQAKTAQLAQTVDQIGEAEKGGDIATGFVEVMHDDDQ